MLALGPSWFRYYITNSIGVVVLTGCTGGGSRGGRVDVCPHKYCLVRALPPQKSAAVTSHGI